MAKKKTPTRSGKGSRRAASQRFRVLLAALFVTGFLILCLVVLGHLRQNWHSSNKPAPVPVVQAPAIGDVQLELDSVLWRAGISFERLRITTEKGLLQYEVRAGMPENKVFKELRQRLTRLSSGLQLEFDQAEERAAIHYGQKLLVLIQFRPSKISTPVSPRPRVAIVMDDLGHELKSARSLIDTTLPVTFAILPYTPKAVQVARLAHRHGHEVMLHIPMEPRGYPAIDPGPQALLGSMDRGELQEQLGKWLDLMPHVVGGNNHMGSALTEQREPMAAVLKVLQERGLFFVDSKTSSASVAVQEAHRLGVPVTLRDVFLDNVREVSAISRQIQKLAGVARRRGSAVGICHPYPETLTALREQAALLREQGIEVVPVSKLLAPDNRRTTGKGG